MVPAESRSGLWESGAILQYLAEKTGKLIPADPVARWHTIQWVHFQMGGLGPIFGQLGFFHKFAGKDYEDKRPRDRYVDRIETPARGGRDASAGSRNGSWAMTSPLPMSR